MSQIHMEKLKTKDCVRLTDEARAAIRRTNEFTETYGRKPSGPETLRIEQAASMEIRILKRFWRANRHAPGKADAERIRRAASESIHGTASESIRRAASESIRWMDRSRKNPAPPDPAQQTTPQQNKENPMSDTKQAAQNRKKAAEEFARGNLLIAQGCSFSLNDYETKLNNNVLVVGGSGTGKTSTIVTPNLKQAVGSYVISDPKGNLHKKYGAYLKKKGYRIQVADFTHPEKSMHYNPMMLVKSSQDILKLTTMIINEKTISHSDPYWDRSAALFLSAIMGYMLETDYKPCDFRGILDLLRLAGRSDEDDRDSSELVKRFALLRSQNPESWACAQFESANAAPYKTFDCTRATIFSKFAQFDSQELQEMMSRNDFDFSSLGKEKTALFVIVSDTDRTMDALANMFFTQAMQALCRYADDECRDNRLPIPVRFILDDFATNCRIDEFPRMISSIRSRGISVMLMIQAESQLVQGYAYDSSTIISNCDTYVYLGGNDVGTAQAVSVRWDKPLQKVLSMPVGRCLVFRRGAPPIYTSLNPYSEKAC